MNKPVFHAFTITLGHRADRIITEVTLSEAFDPGNPPQTIPQSITVPALWDTGASKSILTPSAVNKLGLKSIGTGMMNAAGGPRQCNAYVVNITLPNRVQAAGIHVVDCEDNQPFEAIIGMDIITAGDFAITNVNGKTTVSFRIPSVEAIDYVKQHNDALASNRAGVPARNVTPKVGRNAPCPCGSGQKYKHCHGK